MAREINVGYWESIAHAIFGITGRNPIPGLEETLQSVAVLEAERDEWLFLKGESRYADWNRSYQAVVGENGFVGIRNLPDSGVLALVDAFANFTTGNLYLMRFGVAGNAWEAAIDEASHSSVELDTRRFTTALTNGRPSACQAIAGELTAAQVATLSSVAGRWLPQNTVGGAAQLQWVSRRFKTIAVLAPGTSVLFQDTLANNASGVGELLGLSWREKPLHKGTRA